MHDDPQTGSTIAALRAALQSNLHNRIGIESSRLITLSIILGMEENPPTKLPDIQRNSLLSLPLSGILDFRRTYSLYNHWFQKGLPARILSKGTALSLESWMGKGVILSRVLDLERKSSL